MNKIKTALIFILLSVLTAGVVFLPQIINTHSEKRLYDKEIFWNYGRKGSAEITDRQVAALYRDAGFSISYPGADLYDKTDVTDTDLSESVSKLIDTVFANDSELRDYIKKLLSAGSPQFDRTRVLTMLDDRPVVLCFSTASFFSGDISLDFYFEEKTLTLLNFSYFFNNIQGNEYYQHYTERLRTSAETYYEDRLGLKSGEYYSEAEYDAFSDDTIEQAWFGIHIGGGDNGTKEYQPS